MFFNSPFQRLYQRVQFGEVELDTSYLTMEGNKLEVQLEFLLAVHIHPNDPDNSSTGRAEMDYAQMSADARINPKNAKYKQKKRIFQIDKLDLGVMFELGDYSRVESWLLRNYIRKEVTKRFNREEIGDTAFMELDSLVHEHGIDILTDSIEERIGKAYERYEKERKENKPDFSQTLTLVEA